MQLGPRGDDAGAPLVEVVTGTRTTRFTAADLFDGGGRTLHLGATTVLLGGAPHAWRSAVDAPPLVGGDGTFASAAADVLTVRADNGPAVVLGHLEVSAVVPPRGVLCPS